MHTESLLCSLGKMSLGNPVLLESCKTGQKEIPRMKDKENEENIGA